MTYQSVLNATDKHGLVKLKQVKFYSVSSAHDRREVSKISLRSMRGPDLLVAHARVDCLGSIFDFVLRSALDTWLLAVR